MLTLALGGCGAGQVAERPETEVAQFPDPDYDRLTEGTFVDALSTAMMDQSSVRMVGEFAGETMEVAVLIGEGAMRATLTGPESEGFEMTVLDGVVFGHPAGSSVYFKYPPDVADEVLSEIGSLGPEDMVGQLRGAMSALAYLGTEETDGAAHHRYDLTLDGGAVAAELDVPVDRVPDVTMKVWLDEHHLIQRVRLDTFSQEASFRYEDWGAPLTVEAPPPDLVEPMPVDEPTGV